ncbi:BQ2448_4490 [Microbotryum intermedium]|uniref:BQ2448_4490 protein n=1 Tax=Microbotryum intermedium TaxID=269621 RepID=A0A238FL48_9BASI|nr:BQ2448_4490 [Microbotryum intermedium]
MHTQSSPLVSDDGHPAALPPVDQTQHSSQTYVSTANATAAHHAQLVAHYWHFAQQGIVAPVIEGDYYQCRARAEALEWAQRHGIPLSHPEDSPTATTSRGGAASQSPLAAHQMPTNTTAPWPGKGPRSGRPLPTPKQNSSLTQSVFVPQASDLPPSPLKSFAPSVVLAEGSGSASTPSPAPSIIFSASGAPPAEPDHTDTVPSFTMTVLNDDESPKGPAVTLATTFHSKRSISPPPPLHPRFDPSHPSHYLYHPSSSAPALFGNDNVTCHGCNETILGRKLLAMGKEWHPECFACSFEGCGQRLEHVEFDGRDERVYCILHFEELFADVCYHCKTPITIDQIITIDDARLQPPTRRTYHALHLFCSSCGDPFIEPKLLLPGRDEATPDPYTIHEGFVYCEKCDLRLWKPKCASAKCGHSGIANEWIEIGDQKWHEQCFCCKVCDKPLAGSYMVPEGGQNEMLCLACFDDQVISTS